MIPRRHHLFNPWIDFLGLGGGSMIFLTLILAFYPKDTLARAILAATMLFLAHFVNHPHFAHSYQLFYSDFVKKSFSSISPIRHRYRFAGIMVPAALATFFACTLAIGSAPLLGLAANVMFFTVGWHYAKQGYGILMLDSVQKNLPFNTKDKRNLLWNTHLMWPTCWLMTNDALGAYDYWGLTYYLFDTPDTILGVMFTLSTISTIVVVRDLVLKWRAEKTLPVNGLVAYFSSIYVWLLLVRFDQVLLLTVPFFHSLQYLCVVWRYQINVEADKLRKYHLTGDRKNGPGWVRSTVAGLVRFIFIGGLIGAAGFWIIPYIMDFVTAYDRTIFGATLFFFIGWTFINIHHYFIDAVIWRHENAETRRFMFASMETPSLTTQDGSR